MKGFKFQSILLCSVFLTFITQSRIVYGHDTNVSHPRITESVYKAILSQDNENSNYYQIYQEHPDYVTGQYGEARYRVKLGEAYPYLWGYDPLFSDEEQKKLDEDIAEPAYPAFRKKSLDVLDGVIMEDTPDKRVFSHFQHAYSGIPLSVQDFSDGIIAPNKYITFLLNVIKMSNALDSLAGMYGQLEPSEIAAGRFFNTSVALMGYLNTIDDLKRLSPSQIWSIEKHGRQLSGAKAMWLFGHALHHAEDMSSIAHVSGDAHLTVAPRILGERDDYEAHYIPNKIYNFNTEKEVDIWFNQFGKAKIISNAGQIWGRKSDPSVYQNLNNYLDPNNLSRGVYNVALFKAELTQQDELESHALVILHTLFTDPLAVADNFWNSNNSKNIESYAGASRLCGQGELSKMFYFGQLSDFERPEGPSLNACGLRRNIAFRLTLPGYELMHASAKVDDASGSFNLQRFRYSGTANSLLADWWDASLFGGPSGYYYIEQTMKGVDYQSGESGKEILPGEMLLRPVYLRKDITKPYSEENPLVQTCTDWSITALRCYEGDSLLERFAEKIIPYSLDFLVGYSHYFYDVANLPPYLEQVEVVQGGQKKYGMKWQGEINKQGNFEMTHENGPDEHAYESFYFVSERYKVQTIPHLAFATQAQSLTINLKFNEVIRNPHHIDSEFSIGFALNGREAILGENEYESAILTSSHIEGCFTVGSLDSLKSNCWEISIPSSALENLFNEGLNGRVTLLVKAADLNKHRDLDGKPSSNLNHGALLDATPNSPARKFAKRSGEKYTIYGSGSDSYTAKESQYFWHTDTTQPGKMFGDIANKTGAFAYHPGYDKNHIILFDSGKPEVKLEVKRGISEPSVKEN